MNGEHNMELNTSLNADKCSFKWAELVFFLSDMQYLDHDKISDWSRRFANVTIVAPQARPAKLDAGIKWYFYGQEEGRSSIWNKLIANAENEWIMFVEDDESIRFEEFPGKEAVHARRWIPALILNNKESSLEQYYQMRLVHTGHTELFDGADLPDCTRYIRENNIDLSEKALLIDRESSPVGHINTDVELSLLTFAPQLYLVLGQRHFNDGKYVRAAAQYRQLLKKDKLLPFDRIGAVNGLASCMAEQYKWQKALTLARESIEAEPQQCLPYLIQFKIHELNKQWSKAYEMLKSYYKRFQYSSRANFDRSIGEEETLLMLANIALKAGRKQESLDFFKKLFALKEGNVDRSFLRRVLLLSIELSNHERSVFFFKRIFDLGQLEEVDEVKEKELNDYMSMFMKKGWYEHVASVYKQLYAQKPQSREYKRRLIVALTKTNKMEKARELIAEAG